MTSCRLQHLPRAQAGSGAMATRMEVYLITALLPISIIFTSFFGSADGQAGSFNEITGFSLSPPYFNLAHGARVSATATCGQDEFGRPRSDLYCKLVGGPTNGLAMHNIQVTQPNLYWLKSCTLFAIMIAHKDFYTQFKYAV